ncbi:ATP-dependent RNA helicase DbpA, partial [Salmonella enterica subsp. enterica serovar Weltevreden]|nr:ATP-dependent RNA helicase DbpA [Salmonella enterica subsp. enterica serovar Weltevreden]
MTAFSTLNVLPAAQLNNLTELGYLEMTPVQAAALPVILAGNDVRVQARTGSGKTAAFGLGLLHRIDVTLFQTQALVLCPTRELADQVAGELRRLARFLPNTKILTLCGGQPFGAQRDSLQHAPHIIVATPGRLLDHLQKETVSLDALHILVMDEADRMLAMGFSDAIDEVIRFAPETRQTLLFSATWPDAIAA